MSVSTLYHPPHHKAALTKFWIAILVILAVGVALAWLGAGALRGQTTASGLVFRTINAGSGPFITGADAVLVDYELRLPDGTLKDSSSQHGGPQVVAATQTIPGFGEALSRMQKGGTYHFVVPPKLGYGETPPPGIPPRTNLEFDVHVVDVAPGAASMAAQAASQQGQPVEQGQPVQGQPEQP
ncbi:MAG TPA: FKBP-type peptidyl-prolyl cis-trans isomerase [Allosphingosinicella sp.]